MRIFVIASEDSWPLVEQLLPGQEILSVDFDGEYSINALFNSLSDKICHADAIVVLIDGEFAHSNIQEWELRNAVKINEHHNRVPFIPIISHDVEQPDYLRDRLCITIDFSSETDLQRARKTIENVLYHTKKETKKLKYDSVKNIIWCIALLLIEMIALTISCVFFFCGSVRVAEMSMLISIVIFVSIIITIAYTEKKIKNSENTDALYSEKLQRTLITREPLKSDDECKDMSGSEEQLDALGRMLINLEDIKEYYTWSQKQAKASFVLAVVLCVMGFIFMIAAVALPIIFKLNFEISLIPAVGGVITEIIAGTALVVYRHSLSQLNHYHKSLHEDERFLSAINLLDRFSTMEQRDQMLEKIINSEIQMNLIGAENTGNQTNQKTSAVKHSE